MSRPDIKLMLDNTLYEYDKVKVLYDRLKNMDRHDNIPAQPSLRDTVKNYFGDSDLSSTGWDRFEDLYTIEGGVAKLKSYKNKSYADIIYNPVKKSTLHTKADLYRYKMSAGSEMLFDTLKNVTDDSILEIAAGSPAILEDEMVRGMETFFEQYDSKSSLMKAKVSEVNRWKDVNSYEEFLQVPILNEGKDFMAKFLDIENTLVCGGDVSLEDLEDLIPDYMKDGLTDRIEGGLRLVHAVDPDYKGESDYILSEHVSEYARALIDRAFLHCFSLIRATTLTDLKNIISRLQLVVKQMNNRSKKIVDNTESL